MSSASSRRKSGGGGDEGSGANWMDTYGDLVTLLLTFFVLLFSFSSLDAAKWEALVGSFTGISVVGVDPISPDVAFENPIPRFGPPSMTDADQMEIDEDDVANPDDPNEADAISNLLVIYERLSGFIEQAGINAELEINEDEYIVRMIIPDLVFFETASAIVRPEAFPVLDVVIEMFLDVQNLYTRLNVEGHTDSRPINTVQYPSNWHVSVYRAVNVVSYFREDNRLLTSRVGALGWGEEHPIASNDTVEGMARNRRVEFIVEAVGKRR